VHRGFQSDVVSQFQVSHSTDARVALAARGPYLESEPVERNVMLTLLHDRVATGTEGRYWWVVDSESDAHGGLAGFAIQTPLDMLAGISRMSSVALDALVTVIVETASDLPGVVGDAGTTAAFAGRFATLRKVSAVPVEGQRLYRLGTLVAPASTAMPPRAFSSRSSRTRRRMRCTSGSATSR
jgi:hypothetical protein